MQNEKTKAQPSVLREVMALINSAKKLSKAADAMEFLPPVTHVYNPLDYAWKPHRNYLMRCSGKQTEVLFLGMNPGPWGMAQTGVPFGEVAAVRDWLGIQDDVERPANEHPKRLVEGFNCKRSEVSGQRLWGLFKERFKTPEEFFESHFVINYCPLVFMEASAKNRTPDKLRPAEMIRLQAICDQHLESVVQSLQPSFLVGIGAYAERCLQRILGHIAEKNKVSANVLRILHPSPASPAANKGWAKTATLQLIDGGVWRR